MSRYVLDSYAILALNRHEPGEQAVDRLLRDPAHSHWMTVVNAGEVYYRIAKEISFEYAEETLSAMFKLPIRFIDASRDLTIDAARLKGKFALSYADCFAAALAQRVDAAVVTGDEEFRQLEEAGIVDVEWLPPKGKRRAR